MEKNKRGIAGLSPGLTWLLIILLILIGIGAVVVVLKNLNELISFGT